MMNDKSFEDRLNAIKNGKKAPNALNPEYKWAPVIPNTPYKSTLTQDLLFDLYGASGKIFGILIASILYGYGIEAILGLDWETLQVLGVGFLFNHSLTSIPQTIKKLFTKKGV